MKKFITFAVMALLLFNFTVAPASAATEVGEARESIHISTCNASATKGSNAGDLKITYQVIANTTVSTLGIEKIVIYDEFGNKVDTVYGSGDEFEKSNTRINAGTYTYHGVSGEMYSAKVYFFATKNGITSTETSTTKTVRV